jgi:hypothetical protein
MPVNIFPFTGLTVYEKQNFINKFVVPTGTSLISYSITTSASPIGTGWNSNVTIVSDSNSSITISGYYDNVFIGTTIKAVADKASAGTEVTYDTFEDVPTNPYPYAFTYYAPDTRTQITVTIDLTCNTGTTSMTQIIRNDYNYYRNRFIDLVHAGQVDQLTNTSYVAPDLPLPGDINSETLKNLFIFSTSISVSIANFNLMTAAVAGGYDSTKALYGIVNINPGVVIYSNSADTPAFTTGTLPTGVGAHSISIVNDGSILGSRGSGGSGNSGSGGTGGPALNLTNDIYLTNNGVIGGGGGGGGGGGQGFAQDPFNITYYYAPGGAGGTGAGGAGAGATSGSNGSNNGGGGFLATGGRGGDGGALGTAGVAGARGSGGGGSNGGPGGSAGKAINLNGYTINYNNVGTINGTVS